MRCNSSVRAAHRGLLKTPLKPVCYGFSFVLLEGANKKAVKTGSYDRKSGFEATVIPNNGHFDVKGRPQAILSSNSLKKTGFEAIFPWQINSRIVRFPPRLIPR